MTIEYREIQSDRYPIECKYYAPEGVATGIILGVHGFAGDMESSALSALAASAVEKGTALLCFNFPAHGTSYAKDSDLTIENCKKDLLLLADICRNEHPSAEKYLFATSFGGFISLLCSGRLADFRFVLRAPAVTMPNHLLTDMLQTTPEAFAECKVIECGFERKIMLSYDFYEELQQNCIMDQTFDFPMLIVHGDADDVVPHSDIQKFCMQNTRAELCVIHGADHRFKKKGEIDLVINAAMKYWFLNEYSNV